MLLHQVCYNDCLLLFATKTRHTRCLIYLNHILKHFYSFLLFLHDVIMIKFKRANIAINNPCPCVILIVKLTTLLNQCIWINSTVLSYHGENYSWFISHSDNKNLQMFRHRLLPLQCNYLTTNLIFCYTPTNRFGV